MFRKIDIDKFDEDVIQDAELYQLDQRNPADVLNDAKQRQITVRSLLSRYIRILAYQQIYLKLFMIGTTSQLH